MQAGDTIAGARRLLTQAFREHGLDTPELDARLLVGHALGLDHAALAGQSGQSLLVAAQASAIAGLAARRLAHEPVARILGVKEFWGLPFRLSAETLVPRPETETLVETALAALDRERGRAHPIRVADLGTGTGALLIAVLSELPAARGIGTDISLGALACARDNAFALGCADRVSFLACDYGAALAGPLDLLLCNPPYIARDEIEGLAAEVRIYDPHRALDGGRDGLDAYRALAADARRLLTPDGNLVVELGIGQPDAVSELFTRAGLAVGPMRHDLSGVARALVVKALP